jgi:small multidrug resistance pump|tara:strand:- start:203 stop:433 length:231 start_codon:yes stop_codon:yes gene_type:complete
LFGVLVGYGLAFYFLTFALRSIPLAIVYASWAGLGVSLVAIFSFFFYQQSLQWQAVIGLMLIIVGVVLVNTYSNAH